MLKSVLTLSPSRTVLAFLPLVSTIAISAHIASLIPIVTSIPATAQPRPDFPRWRVGDTWTINAVYKLPTSTQHFAGPVTWRYAVQGIVVIGDVACLHINAHSPDPHHTHSLDLYIDPIRMSASRVVSTATIRGRPHTVEDTPDRNAAAPLIGRISSIPHDLPELSSLASVIPKQQPTRSIFYDTYEHGTFPTRIPVTQLLSLLDSQAARSLLTSLSYVPSQQIPVPNDTFYISVTISSAHNRSIRQLWAPSIPWWLFSESDSYRAVLIDYHISR